MVSILPTDALYFQKLSTIFYSVSNDTAVKQNTERERPLNEWII